MLQRYPLFQIWSLLAPTNKDGDGQNPNARLQTAVHKPTDDAMTTTLIQSMMYILVGAFFNPPSGKTCNTALILQL